MIELFHCGNARSFRVLWMLEEMKVPYSLRVLPYPPKQDAEFKKMNPTGTVPVLRNGETVIKESIAILLYLSTRRTEAKGLHVDPDAPEYARWANWLVFGEASMTAAISVSLHYSDFYAELAPGNVAIPVVHEYYKDNLRASLTELERHIGAGPYILGNQFTAADISVGYNFGLMEAIGFDDLLSERLHQYWEQLQARQGYQRALKAEDEAS